jgi:hypothetical protein
MKKRKVKIITRTRYSSTARLESELHCACVAMEALTERVTWLEKTIACRTAELLSALGKTAFDEKQIRGTYTS